MVAVIRICKNTLVINLSYIALFIDDVKKLKYIEVDPFVLSGKKGKSQKIECLVSKPSSKEDRYSNISWQQKFCTRILKKLWCFIAF